jgi:hypothetical protein
MHPGRNDAARDFPKAGQIRLSGFFSAFFGCWEEGFRRLPANPAALRELIQRSEL